MISFWLVVDESELKAFDESRLSLVNNAKKERRQLLSWLWSPGLTLGVSDLFI